jgi:hypothetical protein
MKYKFNAINNHIVANMNGKSVLIDTGAPSSYGKGKLDINSKKHTINDDSKRIKLSDIITDSGIQLDFLIGSDILKDYIFKINWKEKYIEFTDKHINNSTKNNIKIEFFMDIPMIPIRINGKPQKAFLDTGAQLSYLSEEFTQKLTSIGQQKDFYPTIGSFNTNVFKVDTEIAQKKMKLKFGNLPQSLQKLFSVSPAKSIIGNDIFKHFDKMTLNYKDKYLVLE